MESYFHREIRKMETGLTFIKDLANKNKLEDRCGHQTKTHYRLSNERILHIFIKDLANKNKLEDRFGHQTITHYRLLKERILYGHSCIIEFNKSV